jgi:hypothetical protein
VSEQIGRSPSGAGRGIYVNIFPVLGTHVKETKDPPVNVLLFHLGEAAGL